MGAIHGLFCARLGWLTPWAGRAHQLQTSPEASVRSVKPMSCAGAAQDAKAVKSPAVVSEEVPKTVELRDNGTQVSTLRRPRRAERSVPAG